MICEELNTERLNPLLWSGQQLSRQSQSSRVRFPAPFCEP